ncbi:MAG: serine hydrolase, partial [Bacteroidota bacterium]
MKWQILYLSGVILVFIVSSCGREEKPIEHTGPDPDSISKVLQNLHAEEKAEVLGKYFDSLYTYHAFNGNVLISQRGQVIFMGMYGYADFRLKDTLTVNSTFQLASVSKQFTAIG